MEFRNGQIFRDTESANFFVKIVGIFGRKIRYLYASEEFMEKTTIFNTLFDVEFEKFIRSGRLKDVTPTGLSYVFDLEDK